MTLVKRRLDRVYEEQSSKARSVTGGHTDRRRHIFDATTSPQAFVSAKRS